MIDILNTIGYYCLTQLDFLSEFDLLQLAFFMKKLLKLTRRGKKFVSYIRLAYLKYANWKKAEKRFGLGFNQETFNFDELEDIGLEQGNKLPTDNTKSVILNQSKSSKR